MSGTSPYPSPPKPPQTDIVVAIGKIVVSIVVLGIFVAAICIAWWTKDSSLPVLLGMAGTNAATAVGYWLGDSSGSQGKDAMIAAQNASSTTTTVTAPPATMTTTTGNPPP